MTVFKPKYKISWQNCKQYIQHSMIYDSLRSDHEKIFKYISNNMVRAFSFI